MDQQSPLPVSRRGFLKLAAAGAGGVALAGIVVQPGAARSHEGLPAEEHWTLLYDAAKCTGCKECELACKSYNHLPDDASDDLSGNTFTLIKQYRSPDGSETGFRKYQCMHCLEPACAASCPVAALHKHANGPVVYDAYKCIGCRYCMQACPFGVPRYDWSLAYPLIRKCELCYLRENGPACAQACPKDALLFGPRGVLLEIAHSRIDVNPDKYFEERVYGETEAGGTSVLILSAIAFEKIGLPTLDGTPLPARTQWALGIVPAIFFGVGGIMSTIYKRTQKRAQAGQEATA